MFIHLDVGACPLGHKLTYLALTRPCRLSSAKYQSPAGKVPAMKKSHGIALSAAVSFAIAAALAYAAWEYSDEWDIRFGKGHPPAGEQTATGALLALEEALRIALAEVPGEVVKVERDRENGMDVLEIKVLATNGRVRELTLDSRSGAILEIEDD
jgi:uncharacterized membrane protein YkoI